QYTLILKAVNCANGDTLASVQEQASDKNHVLDGLAKAGSNLRGKLGESLASVVKYDTPLQQASTSSLEALQAYSLSRARALQADFAGWEAPLQKALKLDPNFAMAWAALGTAYNNLGEAGMSAEAAKKSYELRDRASERERLYIDSHYHHYATGDLEQAAKVYEAWIQSYPRDDAPATNLGTIEGALGRFDKQLEYAQKAIQLNPSGLGYANLVGSFSSVNRFDEARATGEEALSKKMDSPFLRIFLYLAAFAKNDQNGMDQSAAWAAGKPGIEDVLLAAEADTAAYFG